MHQPEDVTAFVVELGKTAELFGEIMSESRALLYFEALVDLPLETVRAGLIQARRASKFFPKPAELRELVTGSVEDRARAAWRRVLGAIEHVGTYESVDFRDRMIHAVVEAMGGWDGTWAWDRADGPELLGLERDFVSLYRLYCQRGLDRNPPAILFGQHAIENRQLRGETPPPEIIVMLDAHGHAESRRAFALEAGSAPLALKAQHGK